MSEPAILVKDHMSKAPPSVKVGTQLTEAIGKLHEFRIGGVPVVNDSKEVVGFVSEHDCISKIVQSSYYCDSNALVDDVMTTEPETVEPEDSVMNLAERMLTSRRQVFPVVDSGKLVGIITRSMALMALKEELSDCNPVY